MARRLQSTPRQDGYRMPAEWEHQKRIWMEWPERPDVWRDGGKPAQNTFTEIAIAISKYTPVTVLVSKNQYENARAKLPENVRVIECSNDDAWIRDSGATFVVNDKGDVRGIDWAFNAYGGLYDGLYFPWNLEDQVAQKMCEIEDIDSYRTDDFVLEGGSIHVDGEGTCLTTEMCLLSPGRNPDMTKEDIEEKLKEYLNVKKVIWIKDGIDPGETNGHIDDVACFTRPGEVVCVFTDDRENPFYDACQAAYNTLINETDAKGRALKVHKLCMPKKGVRIGKDFTIDTVQGAIPRPEGDECIASYMNYLVTNNALIVPQYGDEYDQRALDELKAICPEYDVIGVDSWEVVYGGGNIHCITQQQPSGKK